MQHPNHQFLETKFIITHDMMRHIRRNARVKPITKAFIDKYATVYPEPACDEGWDYELSTDAIAAAFRAKKIGPDAVVVEL
jgi:hypothetical protein